MSTSDELRAVALKSHDDAMRVVDVLLKALTEPKVVGRPTSDMTIDQIIAGTVGTVTTGLLDDTKDLPDLTGKLSTGLDKLVEKLNKGG